MKVLALCVKRTLPLYRRVLAPFSVLATRGHRFEFQEVPYFDPVVSYGYDVTLLHQWIFTEAELCAFALVAEERTFVYDLEDPALLHVPAVQETLRRCALVTVPTEFLRKEVKYFNSRVRVLPSCIDFPFFMAGRMVGRAEVPTIGCFGPHAWHLVKEPIARFKETHPHVVFLGDRLAVARLGEDLVQMVDDAGPERYPGHINFCWAGLCPTEGENGLDPIVALEWGIMGRPIIATAGGPYTSVLPARHSGGTPAFYVSHGTVSNTGQGAWEEALHLLISQSGITRAIGNAAYQLAYEQRAVKVAGQYLQTYTKMLPHLAGVV
jgi:glycosyltransferase involved in cell wall biosynthesis